jgi:hypothetical protein
MNIVFKKSADISIEERNEMYRLFSSSHELELQDYLDSFELFDEYALGYDKQEIVALAALNTQLVKLKRSKIVSIYVGSSCVNPNYRNQGFIPKISIWATLNTFKKYPFYKKYIWCLAATYKPYMFYSKVLKEGYPRFNQEDSDAVIEIRDALISSCPANFGQDGWKNKHPVVWRLKDKSCEVNSGDLGDPDISFYHSFNIQPHYGLFTFAPASMENVLHYLKSSTIKNIKGMTQKVPLLGGR